MDVRFLIKMLAVVAMLGGLLGEVQALEHRVALVIGNSKYRDAPLPNPINDAHDMAEVLRRTGFEVIELLDGTQKEKLCNRLMLVYNKVI